VLSQSEGASQERTQRRPVAPPKSTQTSDAQLASLLQLAPSKASGLSHAPLVLLQTSLPGHPVAAHPRQVPVAGAQIGSGALQSPSLAHSRQSPEGTWHTGVAAPHSLFELQPRHAPTAASQTGAPALQSEDVTQPTHAPEGR
jgi:hypothetical protein